MALTKIECKNFTAFDKIVVDFSPGINVFVGANGTGKTHLMKVAYAACDITRTKFNFAEKLIRVFLPSGGALGRMVKRQQGGSTCVVEVHRENNKLRATFTNQAKGMESAELRGVKKWLSHELTSVYIPVKEMLSNAPKFRSLYTQRDIHFEEIYSDILDRAFHAPLRGPVDKDRKQLMTTLQNVMEGKVFSLNEEFFLSNNQGRLEFTLLAEGMRKLGLLWILIQNGTLLKGSVLFWDEPETNLNPKIYGTLMDILLELQRLGVQVFLATHDYVILKELDLRKAESDKIKYHALFRDDGGNVRWQPSSNYLNIHPNAIAETFTDLYDREVKRALGGVAK